jgi:hypothetical protein
LLSLEENFYTIEKNKLIILFMPLHQGSGINFEKLTWPLLFGLNYRQIKGFLSAALALFVVLLWFGNASHNNNY